MTDHKPPILIDALLDDPYRVCRLVDERSPYFPVQRYFRSEAEYQASSGKSSASAPMLIAPVFRSDWAYDKPVFPEARFLFENECLRDAAAELFGSDLVRPMALFTNITWQLPFDQGGGHTDIPAFRGIERRKHPIWLLSMMGHSRLFENERVQIATAVAWFYEGTDGGFSYWPDGPSEAPVVHEGDIFNTAIMGDNDKMFHRVRPVGVPSDGFVTTMDVDTALEHVEGSRWRIRKRDEVLAEFERDALRISLSYKAQVFRDAKEERIVESGAEDLSLTTVFERFYTDLRAREVAFEIPTDPLTDGTFITTLSDTYVREPTVFEPVP
jgi:hypothetical protein